MERTDAYGNRLDACGTPYSTPGSGPAPSGTPITIHSPNGPVQGTLVGGMAIPIKNN
jgi:hypothetical protein